MPQLPSNPPSSPKRTAAIAALCASAAVVCLPLTKSSEGDRLKPYRDPASIVTWCYGETQGPHKAAYTEAECSGLLGDRLAARYAPQVARCVPQAATQQRIKVFASLLDAAYNAGPGTVCKSPMAQFIRAGDLQSGCAAYYSWFVTARYRGPVKPPSAMIRTGWRWNGRDWTKLLPGLVARRAKEAALCREGG